MNKVRLGDVLDYEQPTKYIVDSDQYSDEYDIPVLTAGKTFILGYTNETNGIYNANENSPIILFDDFTTDVRYININFKVKSSAVKILKLKNNENNLKYLYYLLKNIVYDTSSHKRYWISQYSNFWVNLPDINAQNRIVKEIESVEKLINNKEAQLNKLAELIKSQFVEMFENGKYPKDEFMSIAKEIYAGGDKPKDISKIQEGEYLYPVFANGYENEGLQGYSKDYRTEDDAVTISARGTIGYSFIRNKKFTPIVRLITIVPNEKVNIVYLKYAIDNLNIVGSGTSQAQLTVPDMKKKEITIPPIELQNKFANVVQQIDKQKVICWKTLQNLNELKNSKLQKYFGGLINE